MIVSCERCTTQFQLDDSRVPEAGVRVRCSRCKHAFLVEPPAKNELEKIQRVARRALEESEEGPHITQDLPPSSALDAEGPPDPPSAAPGMERDLADDDESDWTFNDAGNGAEGRGGPEALSAARSAVDALLSGGPGGDASPGASDLSDATDEADALDMELDARGHPAGPQEDRLELDARDVGDGIGTEAAEASAAPPQLEVPPPVASRSEPAPGSSSEELGSPADWDIFDEAPPPRVEATPQPVAPAPAAPARRAPAPTRDAFEEPAGGGVWLRRVAAGAVAGLGWTATAVLCVLALGSGLAPRAPAAQDAPTTVAGLQIEEVEGRWLDNVRHGPVYVVSGRLRNPAAAPVDREPVALYLHDADGRRVGGPVPLGPSVETRLLREAGLSEIHEAQAAAALPGVLAPRQGLPFEAVVGPVPPAAERFRFAVREGDAVERRASPGRVPGPGASRGATPGSVSDAGPRPVAEPSAAPAASAEGPDALPDV